MLNWTGNANSIKKMSLNIFCPKSCYMFKQRVEFVMGVSIWSSREVDSKRLWKRIIISLKIGWPYIELWAAQKIIISSSLWFFSFVIMGSFCSSFTTFTRYSSADPNSITTKFSNINEIAHILISRKFCESIFDVKTLTKHH